MSTITRRPSHRDVGATLYPGLELGGVTAEVRWRTVGCTTARRKDAREGYCRNPTVRTGIDQRIAARRVEHEHPARRPLSAPHRKPAAKRSGNGPAGSSIGPGQARGQRHDEPSEHTERQREAERRGDRDHARQHAERIWTTPMASATEEAALEIRRTAPQKYSLVQAEERPESPGRKKTVDGAHSVANQAARRIVGSWKQRHEARRAGSVREPASLRADAEEIT